MRAVRHLWPLLLVLSAIAQQARAPQSNQLFRIAGVVVNAVSGEPLARASVQIGHSQTQAQLQTVVTGKDGRFVFEGLTRGKYWLAAQRRGYPRQSFEQHGNFFTAIAVGPNLDTENLAFRIRPHASISGTILDESGDPVRNAIVMLFRSGVESGRRGIVMRNQSNTDDRGVYHFGNLNEGTYYVAVTARPWYAQSRGLLATAMTRNAKSEPGAAGSAEPARKLNPALDVAYPITYYSGATDSSEATPIVVKMGERATADFTLLPVPAVHLIVKVPDDRPNGMSNSQIPDNLMLSQRVFGTYQTNVFAEEARIGNGEVEISGIPPGRFDMKLQTFGKRPSTREQEVDVAGDAALEAPKRDSSPVLINGIVTLEGHALPRPAFIRLWRRGSGDPLSAQVAKSGEFEIRQDHVTPGKYEVAVFGISGAAIRSVTAAGSQVQGQSVEIASGGAIRLKIDLAQGLGEISGTAIRGDKTVSGAMIVLVPQDYENNTTLIRRDQSDSDGTFTLRSVLPGKYTVLALENAWDLEWLNPSVLSPYMSAGTAVTVAPHGKYEIKVSAQ